MCQFDENLPSPRNRILVVQSVVSY